MEKLTEALELRKRQNYVKSNEILIELAETYPEDAEIAYQCAWSFDVRGMERRAIPYYQKAIELGLPDQDAQAAFLGLGSTYRTVGEYANSKEILEKARKLFPDNRAIHVFYALTLFNCNDHHQAMEILINQLVDTTNDEEIKRYRKALSFYADKIDTVWE